MTARPILIHTADPDRDKIALARLAALLGLRDVLDADAAEMDELDDVPTDVLLATTYPNPVDLITIDRLRPLLARLDAADKLIGAALDVISAAHDEVRPYAGQRPISTDSYLPITIACRLEPIRAALFAHAYSAHAPELIKEVTA